MKKQNERNDIITILHNHCANSGQLDNSKFSLALQHVLVALCNLEEGIVDPIFIPNEKKPNRPKKSTIEEFNQAMASAAMALLMKTGKSKAVSAKIVAKKLNGIGFKKSGRSDKEFITGETVIGWRNEIIKHCRAKNSSMRHEQFQNYNDILVKCERQVQEKCELPLELEDYEYIADALLEELGIASKF